MGDKIRRYPKVGDIFFIKDGSKMFVSGADVTNEEADALQAVGVVYDVFGKLYDVVAGVNDKTFRWSEAADYEIEAIPAESAECEVRLHDKVVGNFSYTKSDGTKGEFVSQLNTWLSVNAPKWEAYMDGETAVLQLSDYTLYENACSIAGCKLRKRVGEELADSTVSTTRNQILQKAIYNGICRARLGEWAEKSTDKNNNPESRMDGETRLFITYPCSRAYYDGDFGDGLRAHFSTYEDYLDACMVRAAEPDRGVGIMRYRDGKELADRLLSKKLLIRGVETYAYPGAVWANQYDCGVDGYGPGTFHQAGFSELGRLMRDITKDTKQPIDPVNIALGVRKGWSQISSTAYRWSCGRYNTGYAWYSYSGGLCGSNLFYNRFSVSAVARFKLD